jgi:uncharacterized protein YbjT (DUF2867 family)
MILVTGAGGTVGALVARELKTLNLKTRLAFHSEEKARKATAEGHDAVALDFSRPETLRPALQGVETVFLLGTGGLGQAEGEINVIREARAAGVRKIVKLSAWAADTEGFAIGRIHRVAERELEKSGLDWTILRPNGFMQNFVNYMSGSIKAPGAFYQPAADAKISHIDARDIARVAAVVLANPGHGGQAYDLTGPEALSYTQAAEVLSRVLGKKVAYVAVSDEAAKAGMMSAGIPAFYADYLVDLNQFYRKGSAARVTPTVKDLTGRDPLSFEQFVRDNASAF